MERIQDLNPVFIVCGIDNNLLILWRAREITDNAALLIFRRRVRCVIRALPEGGLLPGCSRAKKLTLSSSPHLTLLLSTSTFFDALFTYFNLLRRRTDIFYLHSHHSLPLVRLLRTPYYCEAPNLML